MLPKAGPFKAGMGPLKPSMFPSDLAWLLRPGKALFWLSQEANWPTQNGLWLTQEALYQSKNTRWLIKEGLWLSRETL